MTARERHPHASYEPVDTASHRHARAVPQAVAANPRWLKLGIAAALGVVAGTMLFATEAQGRGEGSRERRRPGG